MPLTTLGQETRWAYSTLPPSTHGAKNKTKKTRIVEHARRYCAAVAPRAVARRGDARAAAAAHHLVDISSPCCQQASSLLLLLQAVLRKLVSSYLSSYAVPTHAASAPSSHTQLPTNTQTINDAARRAEHGVCNGRPCVCPVDRQQKRRSAGLLLSALRAGDIDR